MRIETTFTKSKPPTISWEGKGNASLEETHLFLIQMGRTLRAARKLREDQMGLTVSRQASQQLDRKLSEINEKLSKEKEKTDQSVMFGDTNLLNKIKT
jgi:hypothetical protein